MKIVLCSSTKFEESYLSWVIDNINLKHSTTLPIATKPEDWDTWTAEAKRLVKFERMNRYFSAIRGADVVLVFNKDDYIGVNTAIEIGYAIAHQVPIYYVFPTNNLELQTIGASIKVLGGALIQ